MARKPPLAVEKFGGMIPIMDDRALPDQFASEATNVALYSQVLQGFHVPNAVHTMAAPAKQYAFRIPNDYAHTQLYDPSVWMEFTSPDTCVLHTPTIDDQFDRYYWVEPGSAPMYNTAARIRAGSPPYILGIPVPAVAPGVTSPPTSVTHTCTVKVPIGQLYMGLSSLSSILVGMSVTDLTDTSVSLTTTAGATATSGADTLTFASTTGVTTGMSAVGVTQPGSVTAGSYVTGFNATLVIVTPPFATDVTLGDVIKFDNVNQIPPGTTVVGLFPTGDPPGSGGPEIRMSQGAVAAGVFVGDSIRFEALSIESRAYVYTWVSAYGEEGPPSPPTVADGATSTPWTLTMTAPTPAQTANRNLTHTNIYRTVTSSNGVATYFFVAQVPITTLTYTDNFTDDQITGNNQLQSTDWGAPPSTLKGMVSMPNGIILGWDGTDVLFCEPYRPHAWPAAYGLTTDYNVVGAGVFGQSGVLCTESVPHVVTGNHPAIMTMQKVNVIEPCLSQGSIVAGTQGVYYASPNGLAMVNPAGVSLITKAIIGTRTWRGLVDPYGLRAVRYSGVYLAFDCLSDDASQFGGIIDPSDQRVSFCRLATRVPVDNVLLDTWSGQALLLSGGVVYEFDPPDGTQQLAFSWRSKRFHTKKKTNFGVLKIYFDQIGVLSNPEPALSLAAASPWSVDRFVDLPSDEPLRFKIWADDRLVYDQALYESGDQVSLPGGFKAEWWQFEVIAQVNVVSVHIGVDAKDLAQV